MGTIKGGYKWLGAKIGGNSVNGIAKAGNVIYRSVDPTLILDCDFNNNFTNKVSGGVQLIAGNVNGLPSFVSDGSGGYAATFNGSQSLKTNANFLINSDKVSISFWLKTSQTAQSFIIELSNNSDSNNAFRVQINGSRLENKITGTDHNQSWNWANSSININDNTWRHFVIVINRSLGINQNYIYINDTLQSIQNSSTDNNGNFVNNILYIGQRAGGSYGFNGQMKNLKIWNRILSQSEIDNL